METPTQNSPDRLCAQILAEARQEGERLARCGQNEADALGAQAQGEADRLRQEVLGRARTEAARRTDLILATVPVEAGRQRSAEIEALLKRVYDQARQQLEARQGFDYRASLVARASEAISQMSGETFVVKLAAADRAEFGAGLVEAIAARVGRMPLSITISDGPVVAEGGLVVQDTPGRQVWDNGLTARLERLWPELRQQIAVRTALVTKSTTTGGES